MIKDTEMKLLIAYKSFINNTHMGDEILWKTNSHTPFYLNIGGHTQELNYQICKENKTDIINGYNHIGKIDFLHNYIIHAKPPRAAREQLSFEWFKKETKHADLEIWRLKHDISPDRHKRIIKEFYKLVEFKMSRSKGELVGVRYDWSVYFTLPFAMIGLGINARNRYHCSEIVFDSDKIEGIIDSPQGINDALPTPNNNINSGLRRKVWGFYTDEDRLDENNS